MVAQQRILYNKVEVGWENNCVNISEKSTENDRPLNAHKSLSHGDTLNNLSFWQSRVLNGEPKNVLSYEDYGWFGLIRS